MLFNKLESNHLGICIKYLLSFSSEVLGKIQVDMVINTKVERTFH